MKWTIVIVGLRRVRGKKGEVGYCFCLRINGDDAIQDEYVGIKLPLRVYTRYNKHYWVFYLLINGG